MYRIEEHNTKIRDKWIARSLGISYENLLKESFFVATDKENNQHIITFIPSTNHKLLKRCKGYDGGNEFRLTNNDV